MRLAPYRLLSLLVVLTLIGAACGDDDGGLFDTTQGTSASASSDASPDGNDAGSPTTAPGTIPPTTAGSGDGGTAAGTSDVDELLERYEDTPLRLVYDVGTEGDREVMILSQDPTRVPPVSSFTFVDEDSKVIQRGDEMIICDGSDCFSVPGAGGEAMLMGMFGPAMVGMLSLGTLGSTPGYDVDTQAVTIAERDGVCVTYTPSAALDPDVESVRQCVDNELGFTLLMESTDRGASQPERVMLLLEFDRPRPEDFEPTGPVAGLPSG